jgi:hypothetical protein
MQRVKALWQTYVGCMQEMRKWGFPSRPTSTKRTVAWKSLKAERQPTLEPSGWSLSVWRAW